jgi:DNA-binding Lrp family transcriptional regulator
MISARALGILYYLVVTGVTPTIKHLETVFTEGREAIRRALKELEEAGFLIRVRSKVNQRMITESKVSDLGYEYLYDAGFWNRPSRVSGTLSKHIKQNNYILLNSLNHQEYTDGVRDNLEEDTYVGYEFYEKTSSEDLDALMEKRKAKEQEKLDRQFNKEKEQAKKRDTMLVHRSNVPKHLWTSSDIGYEFSDRLLDIWNIKPWVIVKTRFLPALADMRARLQTDGEVEFEMLDLFFKSVDFQKYDDPHLLWKMFIKRAPELAVLAKRANVSEDKMAEAQVAADKSWDWMED